MVLALPAAEPAQTRGERATSCANATRWEFINFSNILPFQHGLAALNNAGQVAGVTRSAAEVSNDTLFRWSDGIVATLQFPGMLVSAHALSENGIVLGSMQAPSPSAPTQVLIWSLDLGTHQVIDPDVPFWPMAINDDRLVCGLTQDGLNGIVLHASTGEFDLIALDDPPPQPVGTMGAMAINPAGVVAGQEVVFVPEWGAYFERPYRWTQRRGVEPLPLNPTLFGGRAVAINTRGDAVGTVTDDNGMRPAFWPAPPMNQGGAPVEVDPPAGYFVAEATAVNNHQHIGVVAPNDLHFFTRAFIWTGNAYIDLTEVAGPIVPGGVARITHLNDSCEALVEINQGLFIVARGILRPVVTTIPGDITGDGVVDVDDLLAVITQWGTCPMPPALCPADIAPAGAPDGTVNIDDLLMVIGNWT